MDMEFISIVTPMYNGGRFVAQTIESVLAQTYPHWEMLIVDDGSKDDSPEIVGAYSARDPRIKLIRQPNSGSAAARNNALRRARGRYICFLDADDLWDPEFLARQIAFIQEKAAGLVYASYRRINECGDEILRPFIVPERVDYKGLLKTCSISCLTAFSIGRKSERFFSMNLCIACGMILSFGSEYSGKSTAHTAIRLCWRRIGFLGPVQQGIKNE